MWRLRSREWSVEDPLHVSIRSSLPSGFKTSLQFNSTMHFEIQIFRQQMDRIASGGLKNQRIKLRWFTDEWKFYRKTEGSRNRDSTVFQHLQRIMSVWDIFGDSMMGVWSLLFAIKDYTRVPQCCNSKLIKCLLKVKQSPCGRKDSLQITDVVFETVLCNVSLIPFQIIRLPQSETLISQIPARPEEVRTPLPHLQDLRYWR